MTITIESIDAVESTDNARPIGDLTRFFRWNEETKEYEMNPQIDPQLGGGTWVSSPSSIRDRIVSPNHNPTVGELVYTMNNLALRERRQTIQVQEVNQQAYDAIRIIGERLLREAEDRGWCAEFDKIIDEVNLALPDRFALPTRVKEYELTWTETYTVTVHRSATYTASDEGSAIEMARSEEDGVTRDDLRDAISNGDYEYEDSNEDYEASEY